jgi:hypothetical protein
MDIDKQRIAAVRTLEALGYSYSNGEWLPAGVAAPLPFTVEADAMHGALMLRADALAECKESSDEQAELRLIVDLIEAYECKRWPLAKELGGKGWGHERSGNRGMRQT